MGGEGSRYNLIETASSSAAAVAKKILNLPSALTPSSLGGFECLSLAQF